MAKLSVNAMIGLWARSTEVVYSVRSSSSELDGAGADFSQAGLPRRRDELLGSSWAPRMEAECRKRRRWNGVDDPISHCLAGNSLLLPGAGKTHLARTIVARLREQGEAVHLVSKTHCSAQNLGLGAQTADHWARRYVRGGSAQKLDWLGGPGLRGAERRREVPAGRLPAVAGRAGFLGRAAHQRAVGAQPAHPRPGRRAQAHGEHALRPRHLQLREVAAGRRGGVPHTGAGQGEAEGALPLRWPDTTLVISHSKRMAVNAAANRALPPEASKLLQLETQVIHIFLRALPRLVQEASTSLGRPMICGGGCA